MSVATASIEIPYRLLDDDRSCAACFPAMLLHHIVTLGGHIYMILEVILTIFPPK
jgi:hypothetical protein